TKTQGTKSSCRDSFTHSRPTMSNSDLQRRVETIQKSFQDLCQPENLAQFNEFYSLMDGQDLPVAARMFIFDQGILSLENMNAKHHQLIDKMEQAVSLGFSVKCMKDFVEICLTDTYDYPSSELTASAPQAGSNSLQSAPARLTPQTSSFSPSLPKHPQMQEQAARVSQDPGYYSHEQYQPPYLLHQGNKPRSFSIPHNSYQQPQPPQQSKSNPSSPAKPSKAKKLVELFLYPENSAKKSAKKRDARDRKGHYT
ncbi:hypothetical protein BOX15_Mlig015825g3, partial [Macrostomum lignano]